MPVALIGRSAEGARREPNGHVRLDFQTFVPNVIIIREAKKRDSNFARELSAGLKEGKIVVREDKAYNDFRHLFDLTNRGVFWVNRAKDNILIP